MGATASARADAGHAHITAVLRSGCSEQLCPYDARAAASVRRRVQRRAVRDVLTHGQLKLSVRGEESTVGSGYYIVLRKHISVCYERGIDIGFTLVSLEDCA